MDLLVLLRVARALDEALRGAVVRSFRQESDFRYRLVAEAPEGRRSLVVSLQHESPWVGRPVAAWEGPRWSPGPFAADVGPRLTGEVVERVRAPHFDRLLFLTMRDGTTLIAELARHAAALVLTSGDGTILRAVSGPKAAAGRLHPGRAYQAPPPPSGLLVPEGGDARSIDEAVAALTAGGTPAGEALRRAVFGLAGEVARAVAAEALERGAAVGSVLLERVRQVRAGEVDPVVIGPEEPLVAAERAPLDTREFVLLPWDPGESIAPGGRFRREDPAATAGLWHEAVERGLSGRARLDGLRAMLRREIDRTCDAEERARSDAARFDDPSRHRRRGEALLAGLKAVRREGDVFVVPDPERPDGPPLTIPAPAGRPPHEVADEEFRRARRAERGVRSAESRVESLLRRRERLEALADSDAAALAEGMRREGLPVDLRPSSAQQRRASRVAPPRLEGVRMRTSRDGWTILVGKSGRENDRLTFKIAGPDDFWLHARGVPGAHVVIRNPERRTAPPPDTLHEAAGLAAWFSDARREPAVDVQWTRRKHVRRAKGSASGTVLLKRFETIRVRPVPPEADLG